MAGLLEDFGSFIKTPQGQGLLAATFGGMAGARKGQPLNSIGRAGLAGMQGYGGALDREAQEAQAAQMGELRTQQMAGQKQQLDFQRQQMEAQQAEAKRQADLRAGMSQYFNPGQPALAPLMGDPVTGILPSAGRAATAPSVDRDGLAAYLFKNGEIEKGMGFLPKPEEAYTLGEGQQRFQGGKVIASGPKKEVALPTEAQEFLFGQKNPDFNAWKQSMKKAGATNVSTKIENKMGESIAAQVGPMLKDTYTQAQGAIQQGDAANRIIQAVDSGKIIAGPLAGGRMRAAQIGQMLGVSGKDDAEIIARSRDVIRGLSELTLQGRKQMTGQGAITESEGALAEKAMSGDIADLTPAEIKQLAAATARVAKFNYDNHQGNLQNLTQDPSTAGLAKFYKVAPFPNMQIQPPAKPMGGGVINFGDLK
jgi:hypothetical protein